MAPRQLHIFLTILFFAASVSLTAQRSNSPNIIYEKEWEFGAQINSSGKGIVVQQMKMTGLNKFRLLDFSLYDIKNNNELKIFDFQNESRSYVYGKANVFFALKTNYGRSWILAERKEQDHIRVSFNGSLGPVLGVLKPVYYQVAVPGAEDQPFLEEKFRPDDRDQQANIIGGASFFKGFGELGFRPGGNAKAGFSVDWGKYEYKYYAIEGGVQLDVFPGVVPISAFEQENRAIFASFYLGVSYGIRR